MRTMSRVIRRYTTTILAVCVLSTLALVLMLSNAHGEEEVRVAVEGRRQQIVDAYRTRKLTELQATLFVRPNRPPDDTYNINVTRAESLPLDREVPDTRAEGCKSVKYDYSKLPHISVIIPFYNEALSMLLRTVHSVLKRTPPELLSEIILVNDNSPNEDLQEPLETYVRYLPTKVKLIRTREREGLIRARLIGARLAKGPVLMFQDAHTEANTGWAEPLLEEIRKNPKSIVQPEVDQIEAMTLEYIGATGIVPRGGFSWDLRYTWMQMPEHEKKRISGRDDVPFRSATLVGCAFAVQKKHFFDVGSFDDAMNIWGGENIELAFRNWMCHGQVLTHPCSRVAHTFKPFAYKFDGDREKIVQKNLMRIAELWMGTYKKYFFAATYNWEIKRTYFTEKDWESLEERKKMKRDMKCKSFEWYMTEIAPEIPRPFDDAVYYGEVFSEKTEACWYIADDQYMAMTYFCFFHRVLPENIFYIDNKQRLKFKDKCLRVDYSTWLLKLQDCPTEEIPEKWDVIHYREIAGWTRVTIHKEDGKKEELCVTQVTNINQAHYKEQMPQLLPCDFQNEFQHWRWTYKFDFNYNFDKPVL